MGVISVPTSLGQQTIVQCVICSRLRPLSGLTVGLKSAIGTQVFACNAHTRDSTQLWIRGWAKYMVEQNEATLDLLSQGFEAERISTASSPNGQYVEQRRCPVDTRSVDVAKHLFSRLLPGSVVILVDEPRVSLSVIRKHWLKMLRSVHLERASTLTTARVRVLTNVEMTMQRWRWTLYMPTPEPDSEVYVIALNQLRSVPKNIHTLYVACKIDDESFAYLAKKMPNGSLVVRYS